MRELLLNNRANNSTTFKKLRQFLILSALLLMPQEIWADYWDIAVQYGTDVNNFHSTLVTTSPNEYGGTPNDIWDDGTMSYDQENNVLTLNGVNLECSYNDASFIEHNGFMDAEQVVTVRLVGSNTITLGNYSYFYDGIGITFTAADKNASLNIVTKDGRTLGIFPDRATPTYSDNLAFYSSTSEIKYAEPYSLWICGTQVTDANKDNILSDGKWSFVHTSGSWTVNELTLKGVSIENYSGNVISSGMDITVKVEQGSTNTISCADGYYPFYSENDAQFSFDAHFDGTITGTNRKPFSDNSDYFFGSYSTDDNGFVGPTMYFTDAGYTIAKCTNQWEERINGNHIYDINHADVFGDGSVSVTYNGTTVNFTLNNANFRGPITTEDYTNVVVDLTGVNYIRVIDSPDIKAFHRSYGGDYTLTFTGTGELRIIDKYITSADDPFTSHEYTDDLHDASANFTTGGWLKEYVTSATGDPYLRIYKGTPTSYDLYIDGTQVTSANASDVLAGTANAGKVSFKPASSANSNVNTLTLDGASFNGSVVSGLENLTVLLKNDNTITRSDTASVFNSTNNTAPLTFKHEGDATLTISNKNYGWPVIWNFASIEYATDGLSLISPMPTKYAEAERPNPTGINNFVANGLISAYKDSYILNTVTFTTANAYPLWIAGTQVTENNENNIIAGAAVTFTPGSGSNKARLSLTNTTLEYENLGDTGGHIISGVGDLEIYFSGSNKLSYADSSAIIRSIDSNATLTFTAAENSSLALASRSDGVAVIRGFKSITMGDGVYQETEGPTAYSTNPVNDYDGCNKGLVSAVHDNTNGYYPVFYLKLSTSPTYPLWVHNGDRYFQATDENKDDVWDYKTSTPPVVFTPATSTLTLNSVLVDDCPSSAIYSGLGNLTINLQEENYFKATSDTISLIRSVNGGKLTITNTGTTASLLLQNSGSTYPFHYPVIKDFASFELSDGLYLSDTKSDNSGDGHPAVYDYYTDGNNSSKGLIDPTYSPTWQPRGISRVKISTDVNYPIWVASGRQAVGNGYNIVYTQITPTNKDDFLGDNVPKVSFIPASTGNGNVNTLKFNGADITDAIFSNLANLTIEFSGTNTLCNDGRTEGYIHGSNPNAIITFKALSDNSSISLDCANGHAVVEGFANVAFDNAVAEYSGSFSYDQTERKYKNNYGELSTLIIKAPTSPTMEYNDEEKVVLSKPYPDGDIYYTINYVDDNVTDVEKTKYSEAFALDAPGTVEAWAEANGATTSKTKGKHFGYKDAPFSMVVGDDPKTPELIPTILDEDAIELAASDPTTSDAPDVATFVDGVITPVSVGTANLTTTLESSATSATEGTVILNKNDQITTAVTVSIVFNYVTFAEGQSYATYCNTDADDLTLPEGITAYAVRVPTSGNYVEMEGIDFLPGNSTGYYTVLLKRDATSRSSFGTVTKYERKPTDNPPVNHLHFTTAGKDTDGRQYILYNDEFVKATGTIRAPYGYLESPNANPARGFMIGDGNDGSTAIDATLLDDGEANHEEWYDLQGRRIAKPTKAGLYIKNGKKMVINNK